MTLRIDVEFSGRELDFSKFDNRKTERIGKSLRCNENEGFVFLSYLANVEQIICQRIGDIASRVQACLF